MAATAALAGHASDGSPGRSGAGLDGAHAARCGSWEVGRVWPPGREISASNRLRRQRGFRHGDPDRDRHQHRRPADHGRVGPRGDRDHAGRQDRLRANSALGHGDPDRDRDQHRRTADPGRKQPGAIAITPNGKTAYVFSVTSDTVTPITTATNTAGPPIPVGAAPAAIAITPDGKTAYVANYDSGTVTPITTATNTAGPPIPVGERPGEHRDHAGRQDRLRRQRTARAR